MKIIRNTRTVKRDDARRGAATVEFAIIMPLFLTLALGTVEMGSAINASQNMYAALREGGRLASMDYKGIVPSGSNINAKITSDIKNFLTASGVPGTDVTVTIVHAGGDLDGQAFDLRDGANEYKLFRIEAVVPYTSVSVFPMEFMENRSLKASLVYRRGRVANNNS